MTIEEIHRIVSDDINTNNRQLRLRPALLNSKGVSEQLAAHFAGEFLVDSAAATPVHSDKFFTVSGKRGTTVYNIAPAGSGNDTEILFFEQNGQAGLRLTLTLPDDWKFSTSFPKLLESRYLSNPEAETAAEASFVFDDLALSGAVLIIDSAGVARTGQPFWARGLNFQATLDGKKSAALGFANKLFGDPVILKGTIDTSPPIPRLNLQATLSDSSSIGYLSAMPLHLSVVTGEPEEKGSSATIVSALTLRSEIRLANGAGLIPLRFEGYYNEPIIQLEAGLQQAGISNLSAFRNLVNGVDLGDIIPSDLQPNTGLQLSTLDIRFNSSTLSIDSISLWLSLNQPWSIISDSISASPLNATQLQFNFLVERPGDAARRNLTFSSLASIAKWTVVEDVIELIDLQALLSVSKAAGQPLATSGFLSGKVALGSSVTLSAFLPLPPGSGNVVIESVHPVKLPDLNYLGKWIGGDDFGRLLPEELAKLTGFTLQHAHLEVNLKERKLEQFQVKISTSDEWHLIPNKLTVEGIDLSLFVESPTAGRKVKAMVEGRITIAKESSSPVNILLQGAYERENRSLVLSGATGEGQQIPIVHLIQDLGSKFGGITLPDVLNGLSISDLRVVLNTRTKDFSFQCRTTLPLDDGKAADLMVDIQIEKTTAGYRKHFGGLLLIKRPGKEDLAFTVSFDSNPSRSTLLAAFSKEGGEPVNLVNDLLSPLTAKAGDIVLDDTYKLTTLRLYYLRFQMDQTKPANTKSYQISGRLAWEPEISIAGSDNLRIDATANLRIPPKGQGKISGDITGIIQTEIPYFEFLSLGLVYSFNKPVNPANPNVTGNQIAFRLRIGELIFLAGYSKSGGQTKLSFKVAFEESEKDVLSLGDVITFVVSLVDPTIDEFEFDPPWNFLTEFGIPKSVIEAITLEIEFQESGAKILRLSFSPPDSLVPDALRTSKIIEIKKLTLLYQSSGPKTGKKTKQVTIEIEGSLLGKPKTSTWDPLNGAPPEIPGQGASMFELRYLGMGRHVGITGVAELRDIGEVMKKLRGVIDQGNNQITGDRALKNRNPLELFMAKDGGPAGSPGDGPAVAFSPESEWLIGVDITLLKTLNLTVIFNDPLIYGLRIELYGELAKNFAGLKFEILYRRISDTIGVYHVDLTLPDFVRYLTVGAVSITLPVLVLDVYTNGDFKVDLGFPWNFNFERSFAIEVLPFTGAGGFYFNKLSAATATSTPRIPESMGVFTPVYEFGLGLKIGLGKSFNKGPLKAEISLTIQGMIEGVISWYNPRQGGERELYYLIKGGVSLVGRLYGAVDFVVIKVEVEVVVKATILFLVEVYEPIQITLIAEVSVSASLTIVFITVKFSFSLTIEQKFTIGSKSTPPWGPSSKSLDISSRNLDDLPQEEAMRVLDWPTAARLFGLDGDGKTVKKSLDLYFQPALTWTESGGVMGEALLFLENGLDSPDTKDFDELVMALMRWTWRAYGEQENTIRLPNEIKMNLENLFLDFTADDQALFDAAQLAGFLAGNFRFRVTEAAGGIQATLFPMFPQLSLQVGTKPKLIFSEAPYQLGDAQIIELSAYFRQLQAQYDLEQGSGATEQAKALSRDLSTTAATEFLLADYAHLIIRSTLQAAVEFLENRATATPLSFMDLLSELGKANAYNPVATLSSRFLAYGLHLPKLPGGPEAQPLYQATGQQFKWADAKEGNEYKITLAKEEGTIEFIFPADKDGKATNFLTYTLLEERSDLDYGKYPLLATLDTLAISGGAPALPSPELKLIDFYREEKPHFALRKRINWEQVTVPATIHAILPFPSTLTTYLRQREINPSISLLVDDLSDEKGQLKPAPLGQPFSWATHIDISVRTIPQTGNAAANTDFLPERYLLAGIKEEEKDLLEKIYVNVLKTNPAGAKLSLLYRTAAENSGTRVKSVPVKTGKKILLIKSNLSTESHVSSGQRDLTSATEAPESPYSAYLDQPKLFVQRLWEGGAVNSGGFYLNIPHGNGAFEKELFGGTSEATLVLVIEYTAPQDPIPDYYNCVIVKAPLEEDHLVLAESSELVQVLSIPAGHLGLALKKNRPEANEDTLEIELTGSAKALAEPKDGGKEKNTLNKGDKVRVYHRDSSKQWVLVAYQAGGKKRCGWLKIAPNVITLPIGIDVDQFELNNLYQLLGYEVAGAINGLPATNGNSGLPIGPTGEGTWTYERMLPTWKLLGGEAADLLSLSDKQNPYRGIEQTGRLTLSTWWQDLYGNKLLSGKKPEQHFEVRYTDPVIGVNQWPSVRENYAFKKNPQGGVDLQITFSFDPSSYLRESHPSLESQKEAINGALSTFRQVYYQLSQEGVKTEASTSMLASGKLSAGSPATLDRQKLRAFVESVYQYLISDMPAGKPPHYEAPLLTLDSTPDLKKEFIFSVAVFIDIRRDAQFVHSSLKDGAVVKPEHQNVLRSRAYLSPRQTENRQDTIVVSATPESLDELAVKASTTTGRAITALDLILANRNTPGLVIPGITKTLSELKIDAPIITGDSFQSLIEPIQQKYKELALVAEFTATDLAAIVGADAGLLQAGAVLRLPPEDAKLRPFAADFEKAFPGLKLAVSQPHSRGEAEPDKDESEGRPLWAVYLGAKGVSYDIREQSAIFFAVPPVSNTLKSENVMVDQYASWKIGETFTLEEKKVDALDLNIVAHEFLTAVEDLLVPERLISAYELSPDSVETILAGKKSLAGTISSRIQRVILRKTGDVEVSADRKQEAADALRQQLLINLVEGFDIETIVQFEVDVKIGADLKGKLSWREGYEPRIAGKAKVLSAKEGDTPLNLKELDLSIAAGKIPLKKQDGTSTFTYLLDTRTPEKFSNLEMELSLASSQIEYQLEDVSGIVDYKASSWLSFVLPENPKAIGKTRVPIPLRHYPMPPSLIQHRAEADPDSLGSAAGPDTLDKLAKIRQWSYALVYEHPDIAQDTIDCVIKLNVPPPSGLSSRNIAFGRNLYQALVNFSAAYPQLTPALSLLEQKDPGSKQEEIKKALAMFAHIVGEVAAVWMVWNEAPLSHKPDEGDLHFTIREILNDQTKEKSAVITTERMVSSISGEELPAPRLSLPGYILDHFEDSLNGERTFHFREDSGNLTFFGDSFIPDRKLTIDNLDIIQQQNAWASIWLSRNKILIPDPSLVTNPAFVFQTPEVRFNSLMSPYLVNRERWDIALRKTSNESAGQHSLSEHLQALFHTILPEKAGKDYDLRINCRYAFVLAEGAGQSPDLLSFLPVIQGLTLDEATHEEIRERYPEKLAARIKNWFDTERPNTFRGQLVFTVNLFSKLDPENRTSLPMLRIEHLALNLNVISDVEGE